MFVYLAALLTFGFYLSAVPVKFALILRIAERPGFGAGAAPFVGRSALRRAERRAQGEKKHLPWRRAGADLKKFRAASELFRRLLRDTRLEKLHVRGAIGFSDAAQTALACGAVRAAEAALGAYFAPAEVRFEVRPDFSGGESALVLWGIFSIAAGHIMRSALAAAGEILSRRLREWTGIPLRTS